MKYSFISGGVKSLCFARCYYLGLLTSDTKMMNQIGKYELKYICFI